MQKKVFKILLAVVVFQAMLLGCSRSAKKTAQIVQFADKVSQVTQKKLIENLQNVIKDGSFDKAVDFCNENAIKLTGELVGSGKDFKISEIKRLSDKNRNPQNELTPKEREIFSNFQRQISSKGPTGSQVIKDKKIITVYKPIILANPMCLQCHGNKTEMNPLALKAIEKKYPQDKAINYKLGELRGMWKVSIQ